MGVVRFAALLVLTLGTWACASGGARPQPFPGASVPAATAPEPEPVGAPASGTDAVPTMASALLGAAVVETALGFRGVPYRNGGSDPGGFDCSGLVQYVFAQHGLALPREVRQQIAFGREVALAAIEPGDLIFFRTVSDGPSHVGVAVGGDEFVHAPSSRGVVRVERFSSPYWANRILGVRRIGS